MAIFGVSEKKAIRDNKINLYLDKVRVKERTYMGITILSYFMEI